MKNKFWIFITLALVITACHREGYFEDLNPSSDPFIEDDFGQIDPIDEDPSDHPHDVGGGEAVLTTYQINGNDIDKSLATAYGKFGQHHLRCDVL